jgi:hypothetical protein
MTSKNAHFVELCDAVRFGSERPDAEQDPERSEEIASSVRNYVARMAGHSLKVNETLTPEVYRAVARVTERLALDRLPTMFIVNDPSPNASAPVVSDGDDPIVIASSGLIHLLSPTELEFVIGHELGHYGLGHDPSDFSKESESEYAVMQRHARSRVAEISADRVGMIAIGSLSAAAMVKIKLASGLDSNHVRLDVQAFIQQLRDSREAEDRSWEIYSTHPKLPVRMLSMVLFADSDVYLERTGSGTGGRPIAEIDEEIERWLNDAGGEHGVAAAEKKKVHVTVAWMVAIVGKELPRYQRALKVLADEHADRKLIKKAIEYCDSFGPDGAQEKLDESFKDLLSDGENKNQKAVAEFITEMRRRVNVDPTAFWKTVPKEIKSLVTD